MSSTNLARCWIAILATDGFEHSELTEPKRLLEQAGAQTSVVAPGNANEIRGWRDGNWYGRVPVDVVLGSEKDPELINTMMDRYDALVLPGGVMNPDRLRLEPNVIALIKAFGNTRKPIAAICHGPWTLIDAGLVRGHKVTSWPSLRADLENAGAQWQDTEVVRDGQLITSRKPADIPAFTDAVIGALAKAA
ncbi:type 1 glutamine amidotransferase domain-containing protein [Rhodanobacter sp. DHG33]|uniref:type 1 glutamine amidotransferase domain-containing protein n=1 Tax=Rhodanobacter sp. DHG33 TaxID=2775921 RepID=UPI0017813C11|nr:type 1 glutamine amidotransferase domain-containing protein [Rhodanobacter sp. DHG33]MBD8899010.1 type 1 glutamine amidotransferase [Rhodanobacter sp. DHG33]